MDSFGDSQPTQATQNVVDPRRLGQQNSGFSDDDISDIICLLVPYSESARQEVKRIAAESSQHMVGRDDTDRLDLDFEAEDTARKIGLVQQGIGEHHIALRFSAQVKNPVHGFTFGRNPNRCDICFADDPHRRLSNIHFRIYFNEYSVLMLEDQSTNGTIVDDTLLKKKAMGNSKRTLTSGSKITILMHQGASDLVFLVRIPLLQGEYRAAYQQNLKAYMLDTAHLASDANKTIVPGPGGHVDLFKPVARKPKTARPGQRIQQHNEGPVQTTTNLDGILKPWPGSDKYNRVGELGRGAFATVYMVTSKFNGTPYAAKELDKRKFMKNGVLDQKVENEMKIMQSIQHPNIVKYIEHLDWDDRLLIIIMEYIPRGDLGKLIMEHGPLLESDVQTMAKQLLDALGYLHNKHITHRDVKPDNILVKSVNPFVAKLTDFGLSKMVENDETFLRTFCGTLLYCAPEVYSEFTEYDDNGRRIGRDRRHRPPVGQRYDHAVDVWSLGGVLFYALTQKPPFPAKSGAGHSELLHQIMTRPLDIMPLIRANVSRDCIDFLRRMLDRRPESRASVESLKNHPWVAGLDLDPELSASQSFDEIEDEELRIEASQLSLKENGTREPEADLIPASDDEILDDDEDVNDENHLSEYESEKENYTFGAGNPPQRLFGEVNVSAIGSSGAIPVERLNLPLSATSSGTTDILPVGGVSEIRDSFESDISTTPRPSSQRSPQPQPVILASQRRSVNTLNNMTFDPESQSLGGTESILEHLNMKSRGPFLHAGVSDLGASKRKSSLDLSNETEESSAQDGRNLKRLRSEGPREDVPGLPVDPADYELFAHIPPITRGQSNRQIDMPVHKSTFWLASDRKSWHLMYPEMTQLQFDAFKTGAAARGEGFGPGKGPLWDLAMKYFPPTVLERTDSYSPAIGSHDGESPAETGASEGNDIPDTQPQEPRLVVRVRTPIFEKRVVACLQSASGSAIPSISLFVTESMISWGRATDNTYIYQPKSEAKVPKCAFKIMLWRDGYDPSKDFRPWYSPREFGEDSFQFYISTKATNGIWINGYHLPSDDCKNPNGPFRYWMRLHDGDSVVVWQTADASVRTELTFKCNWGDSARPRVSEPSIVEEGVAKTLDEICPRAERRVRILKEQDLKHEEADYDIEARTSKIDRERDRSRIFELARLEALRGLRRVSPGSGTRVSQNPWSPHVPGSRLVPTYRSASPNMSELLRAARRG